jgi:hypothetical protein
MSTIARFAVIVGISICVVPFGAGAQTAQTGSPASSSAPDAPLSPSAINDLFKESAGLGKEKAEVLEEAESLESQRQTHIRVEGASIDSERAVVRASNTSVLAACDKKDWTQPGYQQCPGIITQDKALQEKFEKHRVEYNNRLDRFDADRGKLLTRYQAIQAKLEKINSILSKQKTFTNAVDKCDQLGTMEAQSQCMQKQIDGAGTPERDYTIGDPGQLTVVVPKPGGGRTPSQAIEEYINSGPAKPVLRPTEEKKEPPPPGQ